MKSIAYAAVACCLSSAAVFAEEEKVPVNIDNFIRAQMDENFRDVVKKTGGIGIVRHDREPIAIEDQFLIRMNRDTPHSQGVFDLTTPLTVTIPETNGRFISFMMNNQDHYQQILTYEPGTYTFTQEEVGTRYIWMNIRVFVDPNDPDDLAELHKVQDAIVVEQEDLGALELPNWDRESLVALNKAIATVTA